MSPSQLLESSRIALNPSTPDKWTLIAQLGELLEDSADLPGDAAARTEAVVAREKQVSTGLGSGIALPHAMLNGDFAPRAALAVMTEGLEFESLDGEAAHFVLQVVFPDTEEGRQQHLSLLAAAIRTFSDEDLRAELLGVRDPAAALASLRRAESRILS